jgi:hypothetical protein
MPFKKTTNKSFLQSPPPFRISHPPQYPFEDLNMFRGAFLAASRAASSAVVRRPAPVLRPLSRTPILASKHLKPSWSFQAVRCYASGGGLTKDEATGRILDLLKNFDKVM